MTIAGLCRGVKRQLLSGETPEFNTALRRHVCGGFLPGVKHPEGTRFYRYPYALHSQPEIGSRGEKQ